MPSEDSKCIRIGTRKSQLAKLQTNMIKDQLEKLHPSIQFEIIEINTIGDKILDKPLSKIGEKSLFTKELEVALNAGEVDFVVHSLKDMPTTLPPGMAIGAISKREEPFDVAILKKDSGYSDLESLPPNSVVGTSSLRRIAQLSNKYPHLLFENIRGNLNTRLSKLDNGDAYSAIILAKAGVKRLGWIDRISQEFSSEGCLYAVGQGALAVECRSHDKKIIQMLNEICNKESLLCCIAERAFMKTLEGGCSVPVAVRSLLIGNKLTLHGGVFSLDGRNKVLDSVEEELDDQNITEDISKIEVPFPSFCSIVAPHLTSNLLAKCEDLGNRLASKLLHCGANLILNEVKQLAQPKV